MRDRLFVFIVVLACIAFMLALRSHAEKAPRFMVGQTYSFAIDCGIRMTVERDEKTGQVGPVDIADCYMEPQKVVRVLEDGWLEVVDMRDQRPKPTVWFVNPARVWGYTPIRNPHERIASR